MNPTFRERVEMRVAVADQRHTMRKMAEQMGPAGSMTTARHPWFADLGVKVLGGLADGSTGLCPHVGPGRGFGPMFALLGARPMVIQCRLCLLTNPQRLNPVDDMTCDRCSVYSRRGLVLGSLPVGPLLLNFGVCGTCATELNVSREQVPA